MIRGPLTRRLVLDAPHVVTEKSKTGSLAGAQLRAVDQRGAQFRGVDLTGVVIMASTGAAGQTPAERGTATR
jgi:hypothetical protein